MKRVLPVLILFCALFSTVFAQAQTISPSESTVIVSAPKKIGINLNGPHYYGSGQLYKNLMWRNAGFEPDLYRDKFVAFNNGTTTTFTAPSQYDPVVANFWTGATFSLYRGSPKASVCSGTIAGNTLATSSTGPTYTFSQACSSSVAAGDVIILRKNIACTPDADWASSGHAGWWNNTSNGGKLTSECIAPYDGQQSLRLDASISGSTAGVISYIDTGGQDIGVLMNGQYTISGYYKSVGSGTLSVQAQRTSTGSAGNPFNCATKTFSPVTSWTKFTSTCTASETTGLTLGAITVKLTAQSGVVILDDVALQKTSGTDPKNTTVFRDEVVNALKAHCAGASLLSVPCELRDWAGQSADEIDNSIKPLFQRQPAINAFNYDYAGGQGYTGLSVGLEEFLELCALIQAEPYYALPETTGPEDGAKWIEYLNGIATTTYGAKRAAYGQALSWLTVFPNVHLAMGNENWNEGGSGQGLGYRGGAPDLYYDYSTDTAGVWNAMRAGFSWPLGGTGIDLVLGLQTANSGYGVTEAMTRTGATSGELAPYTQTYVGDVTPLAALWNPLMYEVVANTTNSATAFYSQGKAIQNYAKLNVYEFDNSTLSGGTNVTQAVLDSFTDAAGYGTATALQALQHLTFGVVDQNFFSLSEYYTGGPNGNVTHNWGAMIDMGGATNAVRPQEIAMRIVNAGIIGTMYACPVQTPTTSNLGPNHNGPGSNGTPAVNNIPQEYAYCFMNGTSRSMIVINTDIANSHTVSFTGSYKPTGSVTVTRYAPGSISYTNEAGGTAITTNAAQLVSLNAAVTVLNPSSDSLPPYSVNRYDWTVLVSTALLPTSTSLAISDTTPTGGENITLQATVSPSFSTGSIRFTDGSVSLGSATMGGGSARFVVKGIAPGPHSYTAIYDGDSLHSGSTSSTVSVTAAGSFLHTTFSEFAAGTPLNGTLPATSSNGATWSDANGDWSFVSGGGITAATPDLGTPTLISVASSDYQMTVTYPTAGVTLLFRYADLNDFVMAKEFQGEIDLYANVGGSQTKLATIYPTNTSAPLTVSLYGTNATIACGGQTASGTIPSSLATGTSLGFFPQSTGFVLSSMDVSQ